MVRRLHEKGILALHLGTSDRHAYGTYRLRSFETGEFIFSRSVVFFEDQMVGDKADIAKLNALLNAKDTGGVLSLSTWDAWADELDAVAGAEGLPGAGGLDDGALGAGEIEPGAPHPLVNDTVAAAPFLGATEPEPAHDNVAAAPVLGAAELEPAHAAVVPGALTAGPQVNCPAQHPLTLSTCPYTLDCDVCTGTIAAQQPVLSCQECDWDICPQCPGGEVPRNHRNQLSHAEEVAAAPAVDPPIVKEVGEQLGGDSGGDNEQETEEPIQDQHAMLALFEEVLLVQNKTLDGKGDRQVVSRPKYYIDPRNPAREPSTTGQLKRFEQFEKDLWGQAKAAEVGDSLTWTLWRR